jgi:hypothetical protein
MTDWTVANREWLRDDLVKVIKGFGLGIVEAAKQIDSIVQKMGGWKEATEILFGLWLGSKFIAVVANIARILQLLAVVPGSGVTLGTLGALGLATTLSGDTPGGGTPSVKGGEITQEDLDARDRQIVGEYNATHPGAPIQTVGEMLSGVWHAFSGAFGGNDMLSTRGTSGATDARKAEVRDRLSSALGITPESASGLVSNLNAESGIRGIQEINPVGGGRGGFGWAQWTGPRRNDFEAFVGRNHLDPQSDAANFGFLVEELRTKYPQVLAQLQNKNISAYDAAQVVARGYIIPPDPTIPGHVADAARISRLSATPSTYVPDPALRGGAVPAAIRSSVTNDNSRTNTTSNDVDVHNITVNAPGGDPNTIARRIGKALQQHIVVQSDVGLA